MMIKNEHKVFEKQWNAWNEHARAVFNGTYEDILSQGSSIFLHLETRVYHMPAREFQTIAWNAAWTAAHQSHKVSNAPPRRPSDYLRAAVQKVLRDPSRSKKAMVAAGRALNAPGPR